MVDRPEDNLGTASNRCRRNTKVVRVNRWWLFLAALVLLLAVTSGTWLLIWEPDHPLSRGNYRRIMVGMTRDEVAAILDGHPSLLSAELVTS